MIETYSINKLDLDNNIFSFSELISRESILYRFSVLLFREVFEYIIKGINLLILLSLLEITFPLVIINPEILFIILINNSLLFEETLLFINLSFLLLFVLFNIFQLSIIIVNRIG